MKNTIKLILFFMLIICALLIIPNISNAADTTANSEETLISAITSASAGDTITLQNNITVTKPIVITGEITIDGNGYTVAGSTDWTSTSGNQTMFTAQSTGAKLTLKDIDKASVKYRKSNDDVNLRKLFSAKKNVEKELSMNEKTLKMNTKIATELYDRKTEMETYINDLKHKLEQLKIKEDYTKQANEFLSVMDETNDRDSFKISEDIVDTDFNATEFMIEDHKNNVSVETLISKIDEDEEFERFKRGI